MHTLDTQTCDPESKPKSNSQRIKEQLLCKHDKNTRPGFSTKNQTKVSIFISPITLEFVRIMKYILFDKNYIKLFINYVCNIGNRGCTI